MADETPEEGYITCSGCSTEFRFCPFCGENFEGEEEEETDEEEVSVVHSTPMLSKRDSRAFALSSLINGFICVGALIVFVIYQLYARS